MLQYNTDTAILFIIYNRPDTTYLVFEKIKKVRPKRLYIAADGPRTDREINICNKSRDIVSDIDWECKVYTLFQKSNLGCRNAVSTAIDWFFENEEEGIILEDDCVPSNSFFGFCSTMLKKYRYDERIGHISGGNYQNNIIRGDGSYYFSYLTNVWGWAGWRRVWKDYDIDMKTYSIFKNGNWIDKLPSHGPFKQLWHYFFQMHYEKANAWSFQYSYLNLINHRLSIIPNVNLITNIGFEDSENATHPNKKHPYRDLERHELDEIIHPTFVLPSIIADLDSQSREWPVATSPILNDEDGYDFLKQKLIHLNRNVEKENLKQIPSIIHQIYEGPREPSETLLNLTNTWKELHPNWEYRFWNTKDINIFLNNFFPNYISFYESLPYDAQRWDFIRFLILYKYGGLYVDMDYECLEPIDCLLIDCECCVGAEPKENAIKNNVPFILGTAFIAAIPFHPYLKQIIDKIINSERPLLNKNPAFSTGPFLITNVYKEYSNKDEITILPSELVTPLAMPEIYSVINDNITEEIQEKIDKAFAIHYFFGSWLSQIENLQTNENT